MGFWGYGRVGLEDVGFLGTMAFYWDALGLSLLTFLEAALLWGLSTLFSLVFLELFD